jgi:hypothetical protein
MAYADQYVDYGYWDYIYAVGDVLATEGAGSINGIGTVNANGNAIFSANSLITGIASIIAIGYRVGEEWNNSSVGTNTWTATNVSSNTWTDKTTGSNTWLPQ